MISSAFFPTLFGVLHACSLYDAAADWSKIHAIPSLLNADLEDLQSGLSRGLFTSVDLVSAYTARILEVNSTLHMVTELNPDAAAIARSLDVQRNSGTILGPLHGIPILIKNNIATADRMNNTAGSWSLLGAMISDDSTIAKKLRRAGAIILGKTNMSQWAEYRSANVSYGWSAHGGQTYGAYHPNQDPWGSSSGSGVASSIGLALASIGTETNGSIVAPSDANGLVGIKPTVGLTSRYLVIPISEHQDTVGPMARTVKDAAHVLQVIAGPDSNDNYTDAYPYSTAVDYVTACDYESLAGARIGVAWNVLDMLDPHTEKPVLESFIAAVRQIESAGATIVSANFTDYTAWQNDNVSETVLGADFPVGLANYLTELTKNPQHIHSLADVRNWTHSHGIEDWPERDTAIWDTILRDQDRSNTTPRFWEAYQKNLHYGDEGGVLGALRRTNSTAIMLPAKLSYSIPALVGSPIVTVPMGSYPEKWNVTMNDFGNLVSIGPNIPYGLAFMGDRWSEGTLIGYAYAYEQRTMHRRKLKPFITPNTELQSVITPHHEL